MNAQQFIKDHGVDKAREVVDGAPDGARVYVGITKRYFSSPSRLYDFEEMEWEEMDRGMDLDLYEDQIWLEDLKRLVESVDMLKRFGGIELSKEWILEYSSFPYRVELEQAIADYESIYGGEHV